MAGAISARTVSVEAYMEKLDEALDIFRHGQVGVGDDKLPLSIFRKLICTDMLNLFGLCRGTIVQFLRH